MGNKQSKAWSNMSNTFGKNFTVTTCGESHGKAYMAIIDGCPAGLVLSEEDIQKELDLRRPGQSHFVTQRREADQVEIISGLFNGITTGAPIGLLIKNEDARSRDYEHLENVFRPGHADYTYYHKYGIRDHRGGGRSSARETMLWVAAGAIAKKYLKEKFNIQFTAYLEQMGPVCCEQIDRSFILTNPFYTADPSKVSAMEQLIEELRRAGDSIGGKVVVEATNVPLGLGEPVFHKFHACLGHVLLSIPAAKAVEIGDGVEVAEQRGSEHRDEITPQGFLSNHAGGVLGGITTGQPIKARVTLKPPSSIRISGCSVDVDNKPVEVVTTGRHDPCVAIRAVPVAAALTALVIMDFTV